MEPDPKKSKPSSSTSTTTGSNSNSSDNSNSMKQDYHVHAQPAGTDFNEKYEVLKHVASTAHIRGMRSYEKKYKQSLADPGKFWAEEARNRLTWDSDFHTTMNGGFVQGDISWFLGGKLNPCVQCLDRHMEKRADKLALIWESDEPGQGRSYTYAEVLRETCRVANVLRSYGVCKGDPVTIYMPMTPQLAFTMLACARLGAPHSVVFAGFSADALRERIIDVHSKYVFTTDEGKRGGKVIPLKRCVDESLDDPRCAFVERVFVFQRTKTPVPMQAPRDVWMESACEKVKPYCSPESMDAEDTLFFLYTSGSTGVPKGLAHTIAGYLLYVAMTHEYVFDVHENDVFATMADCGWITGHSYVIYGALVNGSTSVMFESTPLYPDAGRYWDVVQRHKITHFYTAPTAIRALMKYGTEPLAKYDLSSLRVLGTVGEPINPEAWKWYYENVGKKNCYIVDTYWQTETGGHMLTGLPGCTPMKPGSASLPFFGVDPVILDAMSGEEIPFEQGKVSSGMLAIRTPWPGIARTVHGDHRRYLRTYMEPYPGYYFTGDGATRDGDGYFWVTGRVDDVLNVSGHRIGSAEVESALVAHDAVAEAAVVGKPHPVKGESIFVYLITRQGVVESDELIKGLKQQVRNHIGAFATPDQIIITPGLPKTRSGKIMRRVLRKIASNEADQLGDVSTLADPDVVTQLISKVAEAFGSSSSSSSSSA